MPERSLRVVSNTTPIIALSMIDNLELLRKLYSEVSIPPAVNAEVLAGGAGRPGANELQRSQWLRTMTLKDPRRADLLVDLDRGEAEAIALALELGADLLLVDERLARRHAQRLGIPITGTLGILLKAKARGFLSEIRPLIQRLHNNRIRLSPDVVQRALHLAGEL